MVDSLRCLRCNLMVRERTISRPLLGSVYRLMKAKGPSFDSGTGTFWPERDGNRPSVSRLVPFSVRGQKSKKKKKKRERRRGEEERNAERNIFRASAFRGPQQQEIYKRCTQVCCVPAFAHLAFLLPSICWRRSNKEQGTAAPS